MGKDTKIPWAHHSHNAWWGCTKISPACQNCYAQMWAKRMGFDIWGEDKPRRFFSEKHWEAPLVWDRKAKEKGERERVFGGSMCDPFEAGHELVAPRLRLLSLIENTPNLDWLLLTKRPEIASVVCRNEWRMGMPENLWLGVTAENQEMWNHRISTLAQIPAAVRFVSIEPMLEPMNLGLLGTVPKDWGVGYRPLADLIHWVICGAESGHGRRPFEEEWARSIRDQCVEAGVPFFYKQVIDPGGKKIETPPLDGRTWVEFPGDRE